MNCGFCVQDFLASKTDGFSGADLTGICQRAVKLAIRECISKHAERQRLREEAGTVDEVDDVDPVPEITVEHFEEAMRDARPSVSAADLAKYSSYAAQLQQQRAAIGGVGAANFRFPRGPTGAGGPDPAADEEDLYS